MSTGNGRSKKKPTGAPKGNRNNHRHGLYSPRLPKGLSYPDKQGNLFRRNVEDAVLALKGEVTIVDAARIHSAGEAQKLCYKNRVECREAKEAGKLTYDLSLKFDAEYRKNLDMRDAKLKELGLDENPQTFIEGLYAAQTTPPAEPPAEPKPKPSDAPAGRTEGEREDSD